MRKMHYFKFLLCGILIILSVAAPVCAENWIDVSNNNENIMLDVDSIKYNSANNSLYYNVKYYEKKAKDYLVVTIQSANGMAGIVSTCKYSNYKNNKNLANTSTNKISKSMKEVTYYSLIYNADLYANSQFKGGSGGGSYSGSRGPVNSGGRPGIDAIQEPDFGPYMRDLQLRLKASWNPPKGNESKRVVLIFKVAKDGRLLSCSVYKSSGLQSVDQAAIDAVKANAPFKPLPEAYKNQSVDIQFTFDYNVFK